MGTDAAQKRFCKRMISPKMQDFFGMVVPERQDESNDAGFFCVGQDIRLFYTIGGMEHYYDSLQRDENYQENYQENAGTYLGNHQAGFTSHRRRYCQTMRINL